VLPTVAPEGSPGLAAKLGALRARVGGLSSALVCFSGGADSALVLKITHDALGDRAAAMTAVSPSLAPAERAAAQAFCGTLGVRHLLVETREQDDPRYAANGLDRCYYCKDELYRVAGATARELGLARVLDGFNRDDAGQHRPGRRAALEHAVASPLIEAGLTKEDVRAISKELGLATWDKPSAPCLASRLPAGTEVTPARLAQVAAAEEALRDLGFRIFRVRHHEEVARLELAADELPRLLDDELRRRVDEAVRHVGYRFVSVDLQPFRSGRLTLAPAP
jgi:pyridinium-3,5-biscarboxylic acid mononucleotide sulfurtransferase